MTLRIIIDDDVAYALGPARTAAVRAGDTSAPVYECLACRRSGDMRGEDTAAVLFVDPDTSFMIMSWVHERCGPSTVHHIADMHTMYGGASPAPVPARDDTTWASTALIDGVIHPAVTIMPGSSTRVVIPAGPGEHLIIDHVLEDLRRSGFARVDLTGGTSPATPAGWAVHVEAGRLTAITRPGGTWWDCDTPPLLPAAFRDAARATGTTLVMVTSPGALPDTGTVGVDDATAAMTAADRAGMLVGALLPLHGTLSRGRRPRRRRR